MVRLKSISRLRPSCWGAAALLVLTLASPGAGQDQFAPPAGAQPYELDNVEGEWINFETQLIKPIVATLSNGMEVVAVANEPNGTVDFFDESLNFLRSIVLGHGICSLAANENGGGKSAELWVTVRHQQAVAVIDLAMFQVTDWLRPPIDPLARGYGAADMPGQVVFSDATVDKAYVTCFNSDQIAVYSASQKTFLGTIDLKLAHNGKDSFLNTPYSMVVVGQDLYVVSHLSGNQTISELDTVPRGPMSTDVPTDGMKITDLTTDPRGRSLPDFDIFRIRTTSDTVIDHKKAVGTVNFNIAYLPTSDMLVVSNLHLRNGEFIGEGSWPGGRVGVNRLTYILRTLPPRGPHLHVVTEDLSRPGDHIAQPTDVVVDPFDRVLVAGYGSSSIGVFTDQGVHEGTIPTDSGPRGLAVGPSQRLYVLSRGMNRVLKYDFRTPAIPTMPEATVDLTDPTPENVKAGRRHFISSANSGSQTTSCNTCHVDTRKDGLAWDLSGYHDAIEERTLDMQPQFWKDRKGVMVTQDMRSLPEVAPYHWRGEQHDLEDFNGAFEGLLKGTELSAEDFAEFKAFVFSTVYTPNGEQRLNREYSAGAFETADVDDCKDCHAFPLGTDNGFNQRPGHTPRFVSLFPQLRGINSKESSRCDIDPGPTEELKPMTGFGVAHNGTFLDSDDFVTREQGGLARRMAFVNEFDHGLAPSTVYSELLNFETASTSQLAYMTDQANRGYCDVAGRGRFRTAAGMQEVGMLWDPARGAFVFDDPSIPPLPGYLAVLRAAIGHLDAVILGVPVGSGERIGLDMDRDGITDHQENMMGLDPRNPDTDGDGLWESYDKDPFNASTPPTGQVMASNIRVVYVTTNTVKVTWETDSFSPTRLVYGLTAAYGSSAGDPFPLSIRPNDSKLWKRRHTAFLRVLRDGAWYHFAVETQGQNGRTWRSNNHMVQTQAQHASVGTRVSELSIRSSGRAPNLTWYATIRVVEKDGTPIENALVEGVFTHFEGGNPVREDRVATMPTDVDGYVTLSSQHTGQSTGDITRFALPEPRPSMFDPLMNPQPRYFVVQHPAGPDNNVFQWSESDPVCIEGVVQ